MSTFTRYCSRRAFSNKVLEKFKPLRIPSEELKMLQSMPEYSKYQSSITDYNYSGAITQLQECMSILRGANCANSFSYNHILMKMAQTHFQEFKFEEAEKYYL